MLWMVNDWWWRLAPVIRAAIPCGKCGGHGFELAPFTPIGDSRKLALVQCAVCGTAVGALDPSTGPRIDALKDQVAAISCGIFQGQPVLDLDYEEDSRADTDANFVLTGTGGIVEIQGTAEGEPFSEATLHDLLALARQGVSELVALQKLAIAG